MNLFGGGRGKGAPAVQHSAPWTTKQPTAEVRPEEASKAGPSIRWKNPTTMPPSGFRSIGLQIPSAGSLGSTALGTDNACWNVLARNGSEALRCPACRWRPGFSGSRFPRSRLPTGHPRGRGLRSTRTQLPAMSTAEVGFGRGHEAYGHEGPRSTSGAHSRRDGSGSGSRWSRIWESPHSPRPEPPPPGTPRAPRFPTRRSPPPGSRDRRGGNRYASGAASLPGGTSPTRASIPRIAEPT